jgi:hypothetical protein
MVDELHLDAWDDIGVDLQGVLSGQLQLPTDPNGLIQMASSSEVLGQLPPSVVGLGRGALTAIGSVATEVAGALPAINLIGNIATGHGPTDPQQIIGALAATASLVNPVAGAILGAAGEAMAGLNDLGEQVFKDLGLIDKPAPQYTYFGFIKKGDSIPWGSTHPNWRTWDYWMTPYNQGWRFGTLPVTGETFYRQVPFTNILQALGRYPRAQQGLGPPYNGPTGQNDFETYFFTILKQDLENWMNANPSISPRQLLQAAVALWNHTHAGPVTRTYSPLNVPHEGMNVSEYANPIEVILSSAGDTSTAGISGAGSDSPPLQVNTGSMKSTAMPRPDLRAALQQAAATAQAASMAAAAPPRVISLGGLGTAARAGATATPAAPKKVINLRGVSMAPAPTAPRLIVQQAPPPSLLSKMLPYIPMAAGVVLMPVGGFLAPVVGVAASALWIRLKK